MARLRRTEAQKTKDAFRGEIVKQLIALGLEQKDLADPLDVCPATISGMLKDVDTIKPPRLRVLIQTLDIDPVAVLRFLGYSDAKIRSVGKQVG